METPPIKFKTLVKKEVIAKKVEILVTPENQVYFTELESLESQLASQKEQVKTLQEQVSSLTNKIIADSQEDERIIPTGKVVKQKKPRKSKEPIEVSV